MQRMRVLLADDHALVRDGVASLLVAWDMDVVGQASDGIEAVAQVQALRPDLVLMDINMPRMGGLEATRRIKAARPDTRIVMLTVSDDEADLFEAVKAGAEGYLLKNMSGAELEQMLAGLSSGIPAISRSLAGKLLTELARQGRGEPVPRHPDELTGRERDVLRLIARGATNREVAQRLVISENTVNFHVKNILGKLHAHTRAEAAVRGLRDGIVTAEDVP
jgi:DNA-binding NarL/FixJ family response regulator